MFLPQIAWKRTLFIALCNGDVATVQDVLNEHPTATNQRIFDMGFQVGLGAAMKFLDCSAPLHVAAWNGQAPVVRWLLNHGAEPTMRDGLNQRPIEIAGSHEVKRVLGAAQGVIDLNDKVETIGYDAAMTIADVKDKLSLQLERMGGRLGEVEMDIETAAKRHAEAEVMELRAALGRKLDKELRQFYQKIKKELKMTQLKKDLSEALDRMEDVELTQANHKEHVTMLSESHEEHKEELSSIRLILNDVRFDSRSRKEEKENSDVEFEVETAAPETRSGRVDRSTEKRIKKLESRLKSTSASLEAQTDELEQLRRDVKALQALHPKKKKACVIM